MILVNPEYLPSVNYFKLFKDNNIVLDYEGKYNNQGKFEGLYFINPPVPEVTYP